MGEEVEAQEFTRADRTRHREKVRRCLDVFARMLREARFDTDDPMTGLEVELNLVDDHGDPALKNAEALAAIADPSFVTELGSSTSRSTCRRPSSASSGLDHVRGDPAPQPQRRREALLRRRGPPGDDRDPARRWPRGTSRSTRSAPTRATACSPSRSWRRAARTSAIAIAGPERLVTTADSIVPEAACTSMQLHVQTSPDQFAAYWNASQAISAVQLAVGANSPYLLGKELWRETRIPLFEQATDTRSEELKAQGVRPRVWFGERWITSVFDLFEENVRYFPALLPITDDEDPLEVLEAGGVPDARRAAAAQRHDLPLEPAGLRHRRRRPAPAGGEPGARRRADGGRHDGQRRALLRPGPRPRGERAAAVVADVVQRRRGELPRGRRARHRRADLLAGHRPGAGDRAGAAPAAAPRPRRGSRSGASTRTSATGCSASSSSAA